MHFYKQKQTNLLFEDENHNKITFKRRDFYFANVFRNLKTAFNSVRQGWQYRLVRSKFEHGVLQKFTVQYQSIPTYF